MPASRTTNAHARKPGRPGWTYTRDNSNGVLLVEEAAGDRRHAIHTQPADELGRGGSWDAAEAAADRWVDAQ